MKKTNKKFITGILIILVFFTIFITKSNANFFLDDDKKEEKKTNIDKTIDNDGGGIFEKIIAKMIRWISRSGF